MFKRILSFSNITLLVALSLSTVAAWYSIIGLTAIFAGAVIPVIIMGSILELGKITTTVWLRKYWHRAGWVLKLYLVPAVIALALLTSMGIFGFLSKAHMDQGISSGDVISKIAVYDEKIKTAQDNIDVNRKALKQLDEAVDQVMGRSTSETGADKAVAIRKSQAKERTRLLAEIAAEQQTITRIREERAPIAAEVRKVEAEVGPIKYIAQFVYGDTNEGILEKAVTWVIITLIVVFDPMAVILLLSSQISFQNFREREDPSERELQEFADVFNEVFEEELAEGDSPNKDSVDIVEEQPTVTEPTPKYEFVEEHYEPDYILEPEKEKSILEQHPYLTKGFDHFKNLTPMVATPTYEADDGPLTETQIEQIKETAETPKEDSLFVQNEEQKESNLWSTTTAETITPEEYMKALMEKFEQEPYLNKLSIMVRTGRMDINSVPEDIREEVRKRI